MLPVFLFREKPQDPNDKHLLMKTWLMKTKDISLTKGERTKL